MSIWNFDAFKEDTAKKIQILLLQLQLIVSPSSLNIFFQYFPIKYKLLCWTKKDRSYFTGDFWTLVNRHDKATYFCVHSSMTIFQIPITQILQLLLTSFLSGVMEVLLFLGYLHLFLNFREKNCRLRICIFEKLFIDKCNVTVTHDDCEIDLLETY